MAWLYGLLVRAQTGFDIRRLLILFLLCYFLPSVILFPCFGSGSFFLLPLRAGWSGISPVNSFSSSFLLSRFSF